MIKQHANSYFIRTPEIPVGFRRQVSGDGSVVCVKLNANNKDGIIITQPDKDSTSYIVNIKHS